MGDKKETEIWSLFLSLSVILYNCQYIKGDRSGGHRIR